MSSKKSSNSKSNNRENRAVVSAPTSTSAPPAPGNSSSNSSGGNNKITFQASHDAPGNYRVFPVRLRASSFYRYIYVRGHVDTNTGSASSSPSTLFATNLGSRATEDDVQRLFGSMGKIKSIEFGVRGGGGGSAGANGTSNNIAGPGSKLSSDKSNYAHITFKDAQTIDEIMKLPRNHFAMSPDAAELPGDDDDNDDANNEGSGLGLSRWLMRARMATVDRTEALRSANAYMTEFDASEQAKEQEQESDRNVTTEDGFTRVVGRHRGRSTVTSAEDSFDGHVSTAKAITRRRSGMERYRKPKGLGGSQKQNDFYKFQDRERKLQQLSTLRDRFDEDKRKLAQLKANRQFKPY